MFASPPASPAASAPPVVVADAPNAAGLTAVAGHVVFSQRDAAGRWRLMQASKGRVTPLPVPARTIPFDADGGTDRRGRPVVVFSRCAQEPAAAPLTSGEVDWSTARGCRVVEMDLATARVTRVRTPGLSRSISLSTPSIDHGRLAAAARVGRRVRILLWPAGAHTPRVAAASPAVGTPAKNTYDMVTMDLGRSSLAFVWRSTGPSIVGVEGWDLRSLRLGDARSRSIEAGAASGTCGFREPVTPTALAGGGVAYAVLASSSCGALQSTLVRVAGGRRLAWEPTDGQAVAAAADGARTYWLRARISSLGEGVPCAAPEAACQIVSTPASQTG